MSPRRFHLRGRPRRFRRLQGRLLLWFLAAIILAIGASAVTTFLTSSGESDQPARVVSRHVQQRLARSWDDPVATEAYVAELRDTTGLDIRVRRDQGVFDKLGRRARPGTMVLQDGVAYVPVVRGGEIVGAIELRGAFPTPQWWRVVLALVVALFVLGAVAGRVAMRLARPLEHVANTAERFGSGDLAARTGIEKLPARWVSEEVRDVGRAFDDMADRIQRVVLEQRELLAAISHELRSPLGRARVALEIARERGSADASKPLDDVERQLVDVDAILGDLLASARAGLADVKRVAAPLGAWVEERAAAETEGKIDVANETDARVAFDAALLGRALHNVFANAWAHGHPKDRPLSVVVAKNGERASISVHDRGPGFPTEILPRAFEPFVTGTGAARSPDHGIGLGLSLVRRIVEAHAGSVSARNADDGGAVVTIELPLA